MQLPNHAKAIGKALLKGFVKRVGAHRKALKLPIDAHKKYALSAIDVLL
jgi:hypothetical protein